MAHTFQLEIATPERLLVREQVASAQIPAEKGYLGVLPDHAPLFAQLGIGALSWESEANRNVTVLVCQGFIEVRDNQVRVLADAAEFGSEIDLGRAEKDLAEAQEQMAHQGPDADVAAILIRHRKAVARVEAAQKAAGDARPLR